MSLECYSPWCFETGSLLTWNLLGRLGSLASNPPRSPCFCLPCSRISHVYPWILGTQVLMVAWQALFLLNYLFSPLADWNLRKIMANIWNGDYGVYLFHVFRNSRQLNANDFLCLPDGNISKYSQGQKTLCCTMGLLILLLMLQQHSCLVLMEGPW